MKFIKNPVERLHNRLSRLLGNIRYLIRSDYKAEKYWRNRHSRYKFDLRGVGDFTKTHEENLKILEEGGRLMLMLCRKENVNLSGVSMLDVGCGTGFYAEVFKNAGGRQYLGIDIVDTLFEGLRNKFPLFNFRVLDVSTGYIPGSYDLIIMLDVAQHITNENKFLFAMENLKKHLNQDGVIIISTNIGSLKLNSFYYITRPLTVFEDVFRGYKISEPVPFFENKMFTVRKPV